MPKIYRELNEQEQERINQILKNNEKQLKYIEDLKVFHIERMDVIKDIIKNKRAVEELKKWIE